MGIGWGQVQPSYAYGTDTGAGQQTSAGGDDFATYLKDTSTGFQYAMNRYYSAGYGRFLTADPSRNSAGPTDPGSWNKYAYAGGNPIDFNDVSGEDRSFVMCEWEDANASNDEGDSLYQFNCTSYRWTRKLSQGVSSGFYPTTYVDRLTERLLKLIKSLAGSNCDKVLSAAGQSLNSLAANAATAQYVLGPNLENETVSELTGGATNDQESVAQYAANGAAKNAIALTVTLLNTPSAGNIYALNVVVLTSLWVGSPSDWQDYTLLHEDLHYSMQTNDLGILGYFKIFQPMPSEGDPFTNWLMKDCKNK